MDKCTHGFIVGSCARCSTASDSAAFADKMRAKRLPVKVGFAVSRSQRGLETEALERLVKDREESSARIKALEADVSSVRDSLSAALDSRAMMERERNALRVEVIEFRIQMDKAYVHIDDLRSERKELRDLCRIGGNALSAIKRGVADAYHEHRCEDEPCIVCQIHALVEECTKVPDGK